MKIGSGIISWDGAERRSQRYGCIILTDANYNNDATCSVFLDSPALKQLEGKKVRIRAVVEETRPSGHIGDMFLKIKPSCPAVGEEIDLGVGTLLLETISWAAIKGIALQPSDGREKFWFDPRTLYRLHDQTVSLFAEETMDDFSAAPNIVAQEADGVLATGDTDGSLQVAGPMPKRIASQVERLGDGLFRLGPPIMTPGARQEVVEYADE